MSGKSNVQDAWAQGDLYESYVGRWSRRVAREFIHWLDLPEGLEWLDVGCGTGALSQTILETATPKRVKGIDRSDGFIAHARTKVTDSRVEFEVGEAQALPVQDEDFDAAVSGLVLNFVSEHQKMVAEMKRAQRPGGTVALYVWDYSDKMQFMRHFWDAAAALDPSANDEGPRFPICSPDALRDLFQSVGLSQIDTRAIDIDTTFKDFDDYWSPFLGGQGPAPSYLMSLSDEQRVELREKIRSGLPFAADGSIPLMARAWAVRGMN